MDKRLTSEIVAGVEVTWGSDNIFADLNRPRPDEHALKSDLVSQLRLAIDGKAWSQTQAAKALGIRQPHLSRLLRGHFENFSVERLMKLLVAVGKDVAIVVRDRPDKHASEGIHVQAS